VQYVHLNDESTAILRGFDSWQGSKWVFPSENPATPLDARNFYSRVWIPAVTAAGCCVIAPMPLSAAMPT
jgi:hypothetical protein